MKPAAATADANVVTHSDTHRDPCVKRENHAHTESREQTRTREPRAASMAECQLNLLEHVESVHRQISARMDLIERDLDGNKHTHEHGQPCHLVTVDNMFKKYSP